MPAEPESPAAFEAGVAAFNGGDFFTAHEVWEDLWRAAPNEDRGFYLSLIQAAVALYHFGRGNRAGAESLAARGRQNARDCPRVYRGIDLARFWDEVDAALAGGPAPRLAPDSRSDTTHGPDHV